MIVWITGLPCSGKTTLAYELYRRLPLGHVVVLDSEEMRRELWPEIGYTDEDRNANVARLGFLARKFSELGLVVVVAAVSPFRESRELVRAANPGFFEVYLDCAPEVRIARDKRGVLGFPLNSFHEPPLTPEIMSNTDWESVDELAGRTLAAMVERGLLHGC